MKLEELTKYFLTENTYIVLSDDKGKFIGKALIPASPDSALEFTDNLGRPVEVTPEMMQNNIKLASFSSPVVESADIVLTVPANACITRKGWVKSFSSNTESMIFNKDQYPTSSFTYEDHNHAPSDKDNNCVLMSRRNKNSCLFRAGRLSEALDDIIEMAKDGKSDIALDYVNYLLSDKHFPDNQDLKKFREKLEPPVSEYNKQKEEKPEETDLYSPLKDYGADYLQPMGRIASGIKYNNQGIKHVTIVDQKSHQELFCHEAQIIDDTLYNEDGSIKTGAEVAYLVTKSKDGQTFQARAVVAPMKERDIPLHIEDIDQKGMRLDAWALSAVAGNQFPDNEDIIYWKKQLEEVPYIQDNKYEMMPLPAYEGESGKTKIITIRSKSSQQEAPRITLERSNGEYFNTQTVSSPVIRTSFGGGNVYNASATSQNEVPDEKDNSETPSETPTVTEKPKIIVANGKIKSFTRYGGELTDTSTGNVYHFDDEKRFINYVDDAGFYNGRGVRYRVKKDTNSTLLQATDICIEMDADTIKEALDKLPNYKQKLRLLNYVREYGAVIEDAELRNRVSWYDEDLNPATEVDENIRWEKLSPAYIDLRNHSYMDAIEKFKSILEDSAYDIDIHKISQKKVANLKARCIVEIIEAYIKLYPQEPNIAKASLKEFGDKYLNCSTINCTSYNSIIKCYDEVRYNKYSVGNNVPYLRQVGHYYDFMNEYENACSMYSELIEKLQKATTVGKDYVNEVYQEFAWSKLMSGQTVEQNVIDRIDGSETARKYLIVKEMISTSRSSASRSSNFDDHSFDTLNSNPLPWENGNLSYTITDGIKMSNKQQERFAILRKLKDGSSDKLVVRYLLSLLDEGEEIYKHKVLKMNNSTTVIPMLVSTVCDLLSAKDPTSPVWNYVRLMCSVNTNISRDIADIMYRYDNEKACMLVNSESPISSEDEYYSHFEGWRSNYFGYCVSVLDKLQSPPKDTTEISLDFIEREYTIHDDAIIVEDIKNLVKRMYLEYVQLIHATNFSARRAVELKTRMLQNIKSINNYIERRPTIISALGFHLWLENIGKEISKMLDEELTSKPDVRIRLLTTSAVKTHENGEKTLQLCIEVCNCAHNSYAVNDVRLDIPAGQWLGIRKIEGTCSQLYGEETAVFAVTAYVNSDGKQLNVNCSYRDHTDSTQYLSDTLEVVPPAIRQLNGKNIYDNNIGQTIKEVTKAKDPSSKQDGKIDYGRHIFGREKELAELARTFRSSGHQLLIYGQKRSGKSTVLNALMEQIQSDEKSNALCVKTSLLNIKNGKPGIDEHCEYDCYFKILRAIYHKLYKGDTSKYPNIVKIGKEGRKVIDANAFEELICDIHDKLERKNKHLILFIDEFTSVYSRIIRKVADIQFVHTWKVISENFSAIMVGQDTWRYTKQLMRNVYNDLAIINEHQLSYLEPEGGREMIVLPTMQYLGAGTEEEVFADETVDIITALTAYSPYYTQIFCSEMLKYIQEKLVYKLTKADIDIILKRLFEKQNIRNQFLTLYFEPLYAACESDENMPFRNNDVETVLTLAASLEANSSIISAEAIGEAMNTFHGKATINRETISLILDDLLNRNVLIKNNGSYEVKVKLYVKWIEYCQKEEIGYFTKQTN